MRLKVVDASAIVDILLQLPRGDQVAAELRGYLLVAPEHIELEVVSTLARWCRAGELDEAMAASALTRFASMGIRRIRHQLLTPSAWQLRDRVRISDAYYVACAQRLNVPLVTTDARLSRTALPSVRITLIQ